MAALKHDDIMTRIHGHKMDQWPPVDLTTGCVYSSTLALIHSFSPVHTGHDASVRCDQTRDNVLATCIRDRDTCVRLLDTRQSKPATTVMTSVEYPPSFVKWLRDNTLIIADMTGHVAALEIRSRDSVTRVSAGNRPVYRLRCMGEQVVVCLNDAMVSVL